MPEVVATGPILYDTQNSTFLPERWLKPLPVLNGNCIHPRSDDQVEWAMSGVDKYRDGRPAKGGFQSQYTDRARRSITLLMSTTLFSLPE